MSRQAPNTESNRSPAPGGPAPAAPSPREYLRILLIAALLGAPVAVAAAIFMSLSYGPTTLAWTNHSRRRRGRLTHGDLWSANVIEGRWLVDPAVSFADRELELAYMHLSDSLPAELLAAYEDAYPLDPGYERRRPALQLHKFLNNIRHFGPDRYVPRIETVLDGYGW